MLTERQKQLVDYVGFEAARTGIAPTYRQIGAHLGVTLSAVHGLVVGCEARGALRRMPNRARAIEVIAPAYDAADNSQKSYDVAIAAMRERQAASKELILAAKEAAVMLGEIAKAAHAPLPKCVAIARLVEAIKAFEAVQP
jgi:SOS-response transcriptional repressor LexA